MTPSATTYVALLLVGAADEEEVCEAEVMVAFPALVELEDEEEVDDELTEEVV